MEEKLGSDNFALVADDIGVIMTGNSENLKKISEKEKENEELKSRNEKLVSANGALLQKIPMFKENSDDKEDKEDKEDKSSTINLLDAFDENGNFKK